MDLKKIVLYVAIAFVSIMLWDAWVRENPHYQQHAVAKAQVPAATAMQGTNTAIAQTGGSQPRTRLPAQLKGKLITVKTDVLEAVINTAGGTIQSTKLLKYPEKLGKKNNPVVLLNNDSKSTYLAQSGLVIHGQHMPMVFQAAQSHYLLNPSQKQLTVHLIWQNGQGVQVSKDLIFTRDHYAVKMHYALNNTGSQVWQGALYNQLSRRMPKKASGFLHYTTFTGAAISTPEEHYQKYKFSKLAETDINQIVKGGWVSMIQHYFISAIIPPAKGTTHFYSQANANGLYTVGMLSPSIVLKPGQAYKTAYQFYSGPSEYKRLSVVAPYLNLTIDFGWAWFLSIVIFWLMSKIYLIVGNWGWSIVIVTLIIKGIFYKLSASSYRSMGKMRKLQPKMKALKEEFGDDRGKLGQATMALYKKEKVNPLGGCLPILVQIPVFLALYYVLIESVELRQAPFIFWVHDLSLPDPFYVLPVLMGVSMFLQQRLSPAPPDPTQAKIMMVLPVFLTALFLTFPSGLVLYWLVNNLSSIGQQWYIMKTMDRKPKKSKKTKKRR